MSLDIVIELLSNWAGHKVSVIEESFGLKFRYGLSPHDPMLPGLDEEKHNTRPRLNGVNITFCDTNKYKREMNLLAVPVINQFATMGVIIEITSYVDFVKTLYILNRHFFDGDKQNAKGIALFQTEVLPDITRDLAAESQVEEVVRSIVKRTEPIESKTTEVMPLSDSRNWSSKDSDSHPEHKGDGVQKANFVPFYVSSRSAKMDAMPVEINAEPHSQIIAESEEAEDTGCFADCRCVLM